VFARLPRTDVAVKKSVDECRATLAGQPLGEDACGVDSHKQFWWIQDRQYVMLNERELTYAAEKQKLSAKDIQGLLQAWVPSEHDMSTMELVYCFRYELFPCRIGKLRMASGTDLQTSVLKPQEHLFVGQGEKVWHDEVSEKNAKSKVDDIKNKPELNIPSLSDWILRVKGEPPVGAVAAGSADGGGDSAIAVPGSSGMPAPSPSLSAGTPTPLSAPPALRRKFSGLNPFDGTPLGTCVMDRSRSPCPRPYRPRGSPAPGLCGGGLAESGGSIVKMDTGASPCIGPGDSASQVGGETGENPGARG